MAGSVTDVSQQERFSRVFALASKRAPDEARELLASLMGPAGAAMVAVALGAWVASHFFGLGELVDLIVLLAAGASAYAGAKALWRFAELANNAISEQDLDAAATALLEAISLLGVGVVGAVFGVRTIRRVRLPEPVYAPASSFPRGALGGTIPAGPEAGKIILHPSLRWPSLHPAGLAAREPALILERDATIGHELTHQRGVCRIVPFRIVVNPVRASLYADSSVWRAASEAWAEARPLLPHLGLVDTVRWAAAFPFAHGYVSLRTLGAVDRAMIGGAVVAGAEYGAYKLLPDDLQQRLSLWWTPFAGNVADAARQQMTILLSRVD